MPSLSSSIVNQQVASVRDVEEALSRQSLYGGDLITNLLELAAVSEERLGKVLAESHDLEPAPVGELPVAPDYVRRLVPGDLAQRFANVDVDDPGRPLPALLLFRLAANRGAEKRELFLLGGSMQVPAVLRSKCQRRYTFQSARGRSFSALETNGSHSTNALCSNGRALRN